MKDNKQKAIICDIDGTFAILGNRNPFNASKAHIVDEPNWPVITTVKLFKNAGYKIFFITGRENKFKMQTVTFIEKYTGWVPDKDYTLFMRAIGDRRKDAFYKTEIYDKYIKTNYDVLFAMEDRNQMVDAYRNEMKIPCFQVQPGNF